VKLPDGAAVVPVYALFLATDTRHVRILSANNGDFAALFTRTSPVSHPRLRQYYSFTFPDTLAFLQSPQMLRVIKDITGHDMELSMFFYSRYLEGDFLTRHSDSVRHRQLAFTLHFAEPWAAECGGILIFPGIATNITFVPRYVHAEMGLQEFSRSPCCPVLLLVISAIIILTLVRVRDCDAVAVPTPLPSLMYLVPPATIS